MQHFKSRFKYKRRFYSLLLPLPINVACILFLLNGYGQSCPPNIDFETGSFDNWRCFAGITTAYDTKNIIILLATGGPASKHHTMYSSNSREVDPYGGFPVICPNGSGHSIKLGTSQAGGEAEGVSYEFTIPPDKNSYSLTYHYAVVFQSPRHRLNEQPRMQILVTNLSDNKEVSCGSSSFVAGPSLPGFELSNRSDTTLVYFKRWTSVTVDLSGNAGKNMKIFFKTADCTFSEHFGYAYVDVDSECDGEFIGATYCAGDTMVRVIAPYGYSAYTWYDSSLTDVLGKKQILTLSPPPSPGTTIAVKLSPDDNNTCPKTLFTNLKNTLTVKAHAGPDTLYCPGNPGRVDHSIPAAAAHRTGRESLPSYGSCYSVNI